jgi:hypothetical protein
MLERIKSTKSATRAETKPYFDREARSSPNSQRIEQHTGLRPEIAAAQDENSLTKG